MTQKKQNCWDYHGCINKCHPVLNSVYHKVNGGELGGRICWFLRNASMTAGEASEPACGPCGVNCRSCGFFRKVWVEEGAAFSFLGLKDT